MAIAGSEERGVALDLSEEEVAALDAVRRGVGVLADRPLDRESAVVAAVALVRLTEDFELPGADAASVRRELETMRSTWSRGNACLT